MIIRQKRAPATAMFFSGSSALVSSPHPLTQRYNHTILRLFRRLGLEFSPYRWDCQYPCHPTPPPPPTLVLNIKVSEQN
jgi:hypothetical protein